MSSLRMRRSITASVYGKSIKYSPTLQPGAGIGDCRYRSLSPAGKRRLWSASCSVRGSMTVEAAVIIPLLLFLIWNLTSAIEMLRLHSRLELALWKYGKVMAVGSYLLADNEEPDSAEADGGKNDGSGGENTDESSEGTNEWLKTGRTILTDAAVYLAVTAELGEEYLEQAPLTYGKYGLSFLRSSYLEEDCIDLHLAYRVSPDFALPGFGSFWMVNRYYARAWTGYCVAQEEEEAKEYVYVTVYGTVYHESLQCSYLKRTIELVSVQEAKRRRNQSGGRYVLCELCGMHGKPEVVYITPDGDRYHLREDCAALKRTLQILEKTEAEKTYRACSRCVQQ